jgi:hypothetical protein
VERRINEIQLQSLIKNIYQGSLKKSTARKVNMKNAPGKLSFDK